VASLSFPDGRHSHPLVFLYPSKPAYVSISLWTIPPISDGSFEVHQAGPSSRECEDCGFEVHRVGVWAHSGSAG
jgi:hypothetical protein